jgi:ribosome-binding factor A
MLPCVGFSKPHVSVGSEFSNKLNVKLIRKVLDNEDGRVMIRVLTGHVSLDEADAIVYVQAMDIPLEKDEQFVTKVSRLDAIMVQENAMESKQSLVVFGESHCVGVQVSKDTASDSNASIDEYLTIDSIIKALSLNEQLLNFLQHGSNPFHILRPIARSLYQELQVATKAPPNEKCKKL